MCNQMKGEPCIMKKIICKVIYDTDDAELVYKYTSGEIGSDDGYEETLYKTPDGKLFLYVNGAKNSIHPEEIIIRMSKAKAEDWKESKK